MPKKAKWNELPCPACKEPCSTGATICPHCQTVFTPEQLKQRKGAMKGGMLGCGGLVVAALLAVGMCSDPSPPSGTPKSSTDDNATDTAKADAIAFFEQAKAVIAPCDAAGSRVAVAAQGDDPIALYRAADRMEASCLATPRALRELEVPDSVGKDAHAQFVKAIEDCDNAYLTKWDAARKLKDALENSGSIAAQAGLSEAVESLGSATMLCGLSLVAPAIVLGATEKELGLETQ